MIPIVARLRSLAGKAANLVRGIFADDTPPMTQREALGTKLAVSRLQWLLDAPLFIDEALVTRLFDAVVRPEYEVQSRVVGQISEDARKRLTGVEGEAKYDVGLSFLTGNIEATGKIKHERERGHTKTDSTEVVENRVDTAGRRLEEIAAVYLSSRPDRIVFVDANGTARTFDGTELDLAQLEAAADTPPRMLAFVELEKCTPIIPMACELQTGETKLLFEKLIERGWREDEPRPVYPPDNAGDPQLRRDYWKSLGDRFSSRIGMEIIEQAGAASAEGHGRIGWIDFRVPIGRDGDAMHLHIVPDGQYYAGTFAYNFVRRGFRQGIRVVGTLKAGMDLNVLAIFDR